MSRRSLPRTFVTATAVVAAWTGSTGAAVAAPPAAPAVDERSLYAGVSVADPFRNLEDLDDPVVRAWADAQGRYARDALDRLAGLPALRARIDALERAGPDRVTWVGRAADGRLAYLRRRPDDALPKLYVRDAGGAERLLLDPQSRRRPGAAPVAIDNVSLSPDGRLVAIVVSSGDSELGTLEVLDAQTGARVGTPVPNVWGELAAIWLPDGRRFVYGSAEDPARPFARQRRVLRTLPPAPVAADAETPRRGRDRTPAPTGPVPDRPLLGWEVPGAPPSNASDWPWLFANASSEWLVALHQEGVNGVPRLWAARLRDLDDPKRFRWKPVATEADSLRIDIGLAVHFDDRLYARTFANAGRYAIVRYDLGAREPKPELLVPEREGVIESLAVARDALYWVERGPTTGTLWRLPHGEDAEAAEAVPLPFAGSVELVHAAADQAGVLFRLQGWTQSPRLYAYAPAVAARGSREKVVAAPVDTGLVRPAALDAKGYVATETTCTARDGARVPLSILARRELPRDRRRPTLLIGYGGYGITDTARFVPAWFAWLERGGVVAIVNPRGSGAYGESWYRAGVGATKPNTWRDAIDCAQFLIDQRWTEPAQLSVWGTSMGGVLAGRAITERPDLFGAAVLEVGILDAIRFIEATPNGPNHALEMGALDTRGGVEQLLAMSAYHRVRDGVRYPATLVMHGLNDARVAPWQSLKMAARLQAAQLGDAPVLLRLEADAGHGVTAEAAARRARLADAYAFLLWRAGDPEFRPR